jgi:hypothetical protein
MMAFLRKSKFPMINIAIIITLANQNCFLLWSDVFIFGIIHFLGQGISLLINCAMFLHTKMDYFLRKSLSKYLMGATDINKHDVDIFINGTGKHMRAT